MQFVIEFYRTRKQDDAHAVIGRETAEAVDLEHNTAGNMLRALELDANDNFDERRPR